MSVGIYFFKMTNGFSTGGVTVNVATGEFTGEERYMLHTVCKRIEAITLQRKIRVIDPHAFTIITTSSEIIGRGFRSI